MLTKLFLAGLLAAQVDSFPWVAEQVGRHPDAMMASQRLDARAAYPGAGTGYGDYPAGAEATCPYSPDHEPAVAYNPKYPYCGAKDGLPGYQICKNNLVPAKVRSLYTFVSISVADGLGRL